MGNLLNFKLTLEDLLGPKVASAVQQVQQLSAKVQQPHKLNVDTGGAKAGLEGINGLLGKIGLAFGAFEALNFLKESVTKFNAADQALGQFNASLSSTKGVVGLTKNEMLDMSTALMGKSLFDDDAITQAQSVLLTFTGIKGSIYKDALPAITDLATKMGGDLQGATVQVGKALNDPIKGITALQRVGVSFTASQKETIKNLVATGQSAKAQALIIKELNTEFGGSAEAASKAGSGGWTVLKNKFDNIRESIGGLLVQGAGKGLPILSTLVDQGQKAVDWVSAHLDGIKAAFAPLREALQPLIDTFSKLWQEQYGNGEAGDVLAQVFNRIGTVIRVISPVIKIAATLLGTIWEQASKVVNVLAKFWESSPRLQKFFSGLWEGAVATFKGIAEAVGKYLGGVGTFIEGIFTGDLSKIGDGLKQTLSALTDTQDVGAKAAKGFVQGYKAGLPKKIDLFATTTGAGGSDAATAFANNKAGGLASKALTADASKAGAVGGSAGGGEGGLGRQQPTDDGISAFITQGLPVTGKLLLNVDYEIRSLVASDALGILAANGYTTTRNHISEYFRLNPGGILIVRIVSQATQLADMLDLTKTNAQQLLANANGRVKQLAVALNPALSYVPVITAGINVDVTAAIAKGQALALSEFSAKRPVFIVVAGHNLDPLVANAIDQRQQSSEFVSVVIGTDHLTMPGEPAIGTTLGAIAFARVNESIAWVQKFPLTGNGAFTAAGLSNGNPITGLLPGDLGGLSDKGFIVVRQHAGLDGFFFSDTPTCTLVSADYAQIENVRTTNKASRVVRRALLPTLNGPLPLNADGTIQAQKIGELQGLATAALNATMAQAGEVSAFAVFIDPAQNVLSTSTLNVRIQLVPVGVARQIVVTLGFTTKLS